MSDRVRDAIMQVPRDLFVPPGMRRYAWVDESLRIGNGQTISQPSLVGRMIDELHTRPEHTVLDIGAGSGYQAAVLSLLVKTVVSVERIPDLRRQAADRLDKLGYRNVQVFDAGDELGWPALAPYNGIVVGAASPVVPMVLIDQLAVGGRLVIPVGGREEQRLAIVERTESGFTEKRVDWVRFVPLIGKGAWKG